MVPYLHWTHHSPSWCYVGGVEWRSYVKNGRFLGISGKFPKTVILHFSGVSGKRGIFMEGEKSQKNDFCILSFFFTLTDVTVYSTVYSNRDGVHSDGAIRFPTEDLTKDKRLTTFRDQ